MDLVNDLIKMFAAVGPLEEEFQFEVDDPLLCGLNDLNVFTSMEETFVEISSQVSDLLEINWHVV